MPQLSELSVRLWCSDAAHIQAFVARYVTTWRPNTEIDAEAMWTGPLDYATLLPLDTGTLSIIQQIILLPSYLYCSSLSFVLFIITFANVMLILNK